MTHKVETLPPEFTDFRAASTAGGGEAITSSKGLINLPFGSDSLHLLGRDYASAAKVVQFLLCPRLTIVFTTDLLVGDGFSDLSDEFQDGDATDVSFAGWDTLANGGAVYVGSEVPVRGYSIVVGTTVQTAARALTIKFWNGSAWVDSVNSEGTKVGSDCLQQNGDETFTVPSVWAQSSLKSIGETSRNDGPFGGLFYWTRWEVSGALTDPFDLREIVGLNRSTNYSELAEGVPLEVGLKTTRVSAVEAKTNTGTANLIVNVGTRSVGGFE